MNLNSKKNPLLGIISVRSFLLLVSTVCILMLLLRTLLGLMGADTNEEKNQFVTDYRLSSKSSQSRSRDSQIADHHTVAHLQEHASDKELNSYLLIKQKLSMKTYLLALSNAVKIVQPPLTETHRNAIKDCTKHPRPPLFHHQHSLELRFPSMLARMSEIAARMKADTGVVNNEYRYLDILWNDHEVDHHNNNSRATAAAGATTTDMDTTRARTAMIPQEPTFSKPLFYYLQSSLYYVVHCSYKARDKENWAKGAEYLVEVAQQIVSTPEWGRDRGVDFLSPASHPKSGPASVHPASLNAFRRQSFLRTDFDFTGSRPKDIIVPYYVPYTSRQDMARFSTGSENFHDNQGAAHRHDDGSGLKDSGDGVKHRNARELNSGLVSPRRTYKQQQWGDSDRGHTGSSERERGKLLVFVGSRHPAGGLREEFDRAFQQSINALEYTDIVYSTESMSNDVYKRLIYSAEFCLSIRGDTASSGRLFSVIEAGCIPVIISDWLHLPFQSLIDYAQFTLTFPESTVNNVDSLIDHLRSIPAETRARMRRALRDVRPLLLYEPSAVDVYALNPVTLALIEALINRKEYCDSLTVTSATAVTAVVGAVSPMCENLLRRLQVAMAFTLTGG